MKRRLYHPVLQLFVQALPSHLARLHAAAEDAVLVEVVGEAGGHWLVQCDGRAWSVSEERPTMPPAAIVQLPQDAAWHVWTQRRPVDEYLSRFPGITLEGNAALAYAVLQSMAVMA